jgi:hypothetical protein
MRFLVALVCCITLVSLLNSRIHAAEIDSVSTRQLPLEDVRAELNHLFSERIQEGVQRANKRSTPSSDAEDLTASEVRSYCDEDQLYTELRKAIFQSFTASWGLKGYDLDRQLREYLAGKSHSTALEDSIYRDITYLEGFSLNLKGLSDVAKVNGTLIGLDKLGHFFAEGWQYFAISNEPDRSISDALLWGQQKESGMFGFTTTGVFSYADLATNLDGWRFWNKILLKQADPLKSLPAQLLEQPYVRCEIQILESIQKLQLVRAWEVQSDFEIADYVNPAWDEGINCNLYASPEIEEKVMARVRELAPNFTCPSSGNACRWAAVRYEPFAQQVIHPACRTYRDLL